MTVASVVTAWSASALAQTVGVNPLMDDYDAFSEQIAEALTDGTRLDVLLPNEMNSSFGRQGCDVDRIERDVGCMLGVTLQNRIDAVVVGEVVGGAIPELVMLRVLDGSTGDNLGQVVVSVERGEIGSFDMDLAVRELDELVAGVSGGGARAPREITSPIVRVGLVGRFSQRAYQQVTSQGTTDFSSAPYPGLSVSLELFPLAPFVASPYAAGFGVYFEQGRHKLVTEPEEVPSGDPIQIPTRHNMVSYGASLAVPVADGIRVVPYAGMREVEYAVAYNPQLASNSYTSLDVGLNVEYDLAMMEGLVVYGGGGFRPGVEGEPIELPRTAPAEGEDPTFVAEATGSGFAGRLGARYDLPMHFFAGVELELESYAIDYADPDFASTASDSFQMVAFTLGYTY